MRNGYPLFELHRHLDGSVRLQTILDLAHQHKLPLPADTPDSLRPYVQITEPVEGVMAFISRFAWMQLVMVDMDAVRRIAYENVADAAAEGIDYIELRFSPLFMAEKHHLEPAGIVRAVCEGVAQGEADHGIKANLIGIMSRTYGEERCWYELDAILRGRGPAVVAIDLAGDEINYPGRLFVDHIRKARDAGLAGDRACRGDSAGFSQCKVGSREFVGRREGDGGRPIGACAPRGGRPGVIGVDCGTRHCH